MSEIAPIGSSGLPATPCQGATGPGSAQAAAGTGAAQGAGLSQTTSATSYAGATSIQETYQATSLSASSQINMMMAQFGLDTPSNGLMRELIILALLLKLLEMLEGRKDEGSLLYGALGQSQNATLLWSSVGYSASMSMESSSYQMSVSEAYASSSMTAGQASGAVLSDAVAPTDTQGALDAGDAGHQLNVVA